MGDTVDSRRVREFADSAAELEAKIADLESLVRESRNTVFFTGAGISTAAGISDYRGPTGVWTKQRVMKLQRRRVEGSLNETGQAELTLLLTEAKKKGKD